MNEDTKGHIDRFNSIIQECENLCIMTRDSDLQKDACAKLQSMIADCEALKLQAVAAKDEDAANTFLGFECVAGCLHAELAMWVLLKNEKPDEAWEQLVSAQMAAASAARAHGGFAHLELRAQRLEEIERLVFPPQTFVSAGLIVRHQECSICGSEYGECEHLAGKPYWGRFCCIITRGIEGNHVALVKNPEDKGCRIMTVAVDGGERNRMTWKVEPARPNEPSLSANSGLAGEGTPEKGLLVRARLLRANRGSRMQ